MTILGDVALDARLEELHALSDAQEIETRKYFERRAKEGTLSWEGVDPETRVYLADKLVALDRDKALFCHNLCRATGARRIVEVGTSYGVSTLYLASAAKANAALGGGEAVVIGAEHEPGKAAAARKLFAETGLADVIDLREGDLRETLKSLEGPIDFVLFDIWVEMARPALELIAPRLRPGSVLIADNTTAVPGPYAAYFAFLREGRFSTLTLPFSGGLEMTVSLG